MLRVVVLTSLAVLASATPASAYRLQPHRWYSTTLTYHDATGKYGPQIRAAVRAINSSGSRVRIRATSRRSARVSVRIERRLASAGQARYRSFNGITSNAIIALRADLASNFRTPPEVNAGITAVIAHEFAHVLGLDHEDRRCATMNSLLWSECRGGKPWEYRCRVLERDDIRGLVRRYGGRVRGVGADLCAAEAVPGAVTGLAAATVGYNPGTIRLTFRRPAGLRAEVLRRTGACTGTTSGFEAVRTVQADTVDAFAYGVERYCFAVRAVGRYERPGPFVYLDYAYLGAPPQAEFRWLSNGLTVEFGDFSEDLEERIVGWRWDFGDGTSSTEREPTHTYAAAGSYQVTLTVTDDSGQTGTVTHVIGV